MSTHDPYPYDEDEFDVQGADRVPQGVHRAPVSRWRQALPFLVVLVLAPVLAFVVVQAVSRDSTPGPAATPGASESAAGEDVSGDAGAGDEPSEDPTDGEGETDDPSEEPSDEPSETVELDQGLAVWVLNGAGVGGLAGETAGTLTDAGWSNVVADDYAYNDPADSTIYYRDASMAEEAEAIGAELGIDALVESESAAPNGIYVVLRPDFGN
ncbi:LytR C-terminal domain-containing protein [Ruania halotolerans]|uniref:LytR C-terminal domain-containing protein n=1 Tax=Ruania halotolerans TaxID=2897773 RepID=UPI001E5BD221|nr:LytR C-terminal domain-containing protein [Ruania halotolerans]UFU07216.1 LytR C-terminal domain-containing protein [Ruania halotolerans]